ncbi:unnamed protein product [Ilex paraguariensis]|uniref:Uncharacterized protein n=1 Tax=Ilex paraguariensis TaxID=185542 RepID=A0ABC8UXB1_9AQUA
MERLQAALTYRVQDIHKIQYLSGYREGRMVVRLVNTLSRNQKEASYCLSPSNAGRLLPLMDLIPAFPLKHQLILAGWLWIKGW